MGAIDTHEVITAALAVTDAAVAMFGQAFDEAKRKTRRYHMEEVLLKKWILGSGGASGQNCEACEACAELDWVDVDYTYDEGPEPVDAPPLHFHCDCEITFKSSTRRVYD